MSIRIEDKLNEAKITLEPDDVFVLLAANAKHLAQLLMDLDESSFKKAYNDRVCSFKMGKPICDEVEASAFGIGIYHNLDAVNDAVLACMVNIESSSKELEAFCHKHNGHILVELS